MTPASLFFRPRRSALVLGAVVIALHYWTINGLGAHLDPVKTEPAPRPAAINAQLRLTLPPAAPAPAPVLTPPKPAAVPHRAPPKPPAAVTDGAPPASTAAPGSAASSKDSNEDSSEAPAGPAMPSSEQAGAAPAEPALPSPAAAAKDNAAQAEKPAGMARRYNVNLPPSADFALELKRTDADGTNWSGVAAMSWQVRDGRYKVTVEAGLSVLVTRINLLVLTSEGGIDDAGIAPVTLTEKRKGRSLTATHFNRDDNRITFSASDRAYPLPPGAQDKASLPFQLAGIGRSDVNQFGGDIDIFVGEDKDANMFRFVLIGEEEIDTRMGRLVTLHLSRPPKRGTYSSRLDIWLAPSQGWYPVQFRNTEANGAVTTQTVSRITLTDATGK